MPAVRLRLLRSGIANLPDDIEVCAVRMPGRDERLSEPFRTDIDSLVCELLDALRPAHDRPVVLLGYSLGALIAFEYARRIRHTEVGEPSHLVVAARRAPQLRRDNGLVQLTDGEFIREIGLRYGGIPQPILDDPELLAYYLPVMRTDMRLLASYQYRDAEPLRCPITAVGGATDPQVTSNDLDAWSLHTHGSFDRRQVPGGHFFVTASQRRSFLDHVVKRIGAGGQPARSTAPAHADSRD